MFFLVLILLILPYSSASTELDHYVQKFRYRPLEVPAKNPALYALGLELFYDKTLSGNDNISCQSCHSINGFSADALPLGLGEGASGTAGSRLQSEGMILNRHTPSIYNLALPDVRSLFWDGRISQNREGGWNTPVPLPSEVSSTLSSLAAVQAIFPLANPAEMLGKHSELSTTKAWEFVLEKILKGRYQYKYEALFKKAFPGQKTFNIGHVGNALAELIRHHFSAINTPWDQYLRGTKGALTERMKNGAILFHEKADCFSCHNGNQFTSWGFQNIGIPQIKNDDQGRYLITKKDDDMYKFRVPPLRNVALTAPYMHSGVFKNLWEVVEHYDDPIHSLRNFQWNPKHPNYHDSLNLDTDPLNQDNRERTLSRLLTRKLNLTIEEKKDLVCFLAVALTDMSLQKELIKKGITNDISNCTPRPH